MFARGLAFVAVAWLAVPSAPALAAEPIGDWKIEPSDVRCVAVRQYGTADKPVTLALKAPPTENTLQLAILRAGFRKGAVQTEASVIIDGQNSATSALSYPLAGDKRRVAHLINLDAAQSVAIRTGKDLEVTVHEGINEEFPLGPTREALDKLDTCLERLRDAWNIGDEHKARFTSRAKGNLQAVFRSDDYPKAAMHALQQGTATVVILIDEVGAPRDCTLVQTSGAAVLDSRTCGIILERMKFQPALGSEGKPIRSAYVQRVRWRFP